MAQRKPAQMADDQADSEENDQIESIMGELGGDNIKLSLYRIAPGTGSRGAWIDDISADQIDDMKRYVRDEFGGGTYVVRILRNGKFWKQIGFAIEAARKIPGAAAPAPAAGDQLLQLLQRQEENQRQILQLLANRNDRPAFDPFDMFSKVAELVKQTKADAPAVGAADLMTAWNKGLETAQKQLELARSLNSGAGGGETGVMDLIRSIIESVGPAVAPAIAASLGQQQQPKPAAPAQPLLPQPAGNDAHNANGHAAALDAHLQSMMKNLSAKAALNADVGLYAEWTLDNLDPQLTAMLLQTPGILDRLETPFPAVKQFRPWFDALLQQMITMSQGNEGLESEQAGDDQSADAAGAHS